MAQHARNLPHGRPRGRPRRRPAWMRAMDAREAKRRQLSLLDQRGNEGDDGKPLFPTRLGGERP